jgi:hypothetical protein
MSEYGFCYCFTYLHSTARGYDVYNQNHEKRQDLADGKEKVK